jgi:hypothetical protein
MQRIFLAQFELHIEHSVLRMFDRGRRLGEFLNIVRLRNAIRSEALSGFELAGHCYGMKFACFDC